MTTTNGADEKVLKTDAKGRLRTSVERRATLLEEFDKSGLNAKKFAELAGIKYQTLPTWLQKRRRRGSDTRQGNRHSYNRCPLLQSIAMKRKILTDI